MRRSTEEVLDRQRGARGGIPDGWACRGFAVRLDPAIAAQGGFEYFGHLEDIRTRLAEFLVRDVDLATEPIRQPRLRHDLEQERVVAFQ